MTEEERIKKRHHLRCTRKMLGHLKQREKNSESFIRHAFLSCENPGIIVKEMYGDKFDERGIHFLLQVRKDGRFRELAEALCRHGVITAKEVPQDIDLEIEAERFLKTLPWRINTPPIPDEYIDWNTYMAIVRHFVEWGKNNL